MFAHKTVKQVADHFDDVIGKLTKKPAVIGHSFGGLALRSFSSASSSTLGKAGAPHPW